VRVTPPRAATADPDEPLVAANVARVSVAADPRLPQVGSQITRKHKGRTVTVTVLADGFEYEGERYRSLSAVAKAVTGSHMNGFRFFGCALCKPRGHNARKCDEPRGELMDDRHSKGGATV
jgi:hypothetical protein